MSQTTYKHSGAAAMVQLHEQHLKLFLETWNQAKGAGLVLPKTNDKDYASLETVLRHVLAAARSYMTWMCEKLELPDPEIRPAPEASDVAQEASAYVDHLLERWETPLANVEEERFFRPSFLTRWGDNAAIEAMLEHAVMHPIRHRFQLENLLKEQAR